MDASNWTSVFNEFRSGAQFRVTAAVSMTDKATEAVLTARELRRQIAAGAVSEIRLMPPEACVERVMTSPLAPCGESLPLAYLSLSLKQVIASRA